MVSTPKSRLNNPPSVPKAILPSVFAPVSCLTNSIISLSVFVFSAGYSLVVSISMLTHGCDSLYGVTMSFAKALMSLIIFDGSSAGRLRISKSKRQEFGTIFSAVPPLIVPTWSVV